MTQLLKTVPKITAWLDAYGVKNYILIPNKDDGLIVNVNGDVDLGGKKLNSIPVKFNHVMGSFSCIRNNLTSLEGSPCTVDKSFVCEHNELMSLDFSPQNVGENFNCNYNFLTTLKGGPQKVNGHFWSNGNELYNLLYGPTEVGGHFCCDNNLLSTLEGCPIKVGGHFICRANKIKSLEFCPQTINGFFYSDNNPLLGKTQYINDFETIYQIHLKTLIELEKNNLSTMIVSKPFSSIVSKI